MNRSSIYFYPHRYLRDRQLDTIRNWPAGEALNASSFQTRAGAQVTAETVLHRKPGKPLHAVVPMINIKRRSREVPAGAAVYLWGGIMDRGPFLTDIDNPLALTGYNIRAIRLYRPVLRYLLGRPRCLEIRCLSRACLESLRLLIGESVAQKAQVHYPHVRPAGIRAPSRRSSAACRFLFVGTQFEIKGGVALLRAFRRVREAFPGATLQIVTHLPFHLRLFTRGDCGIDVVDANLDRETLYRDYLLNADVLVHPTYAESFGMVVLEAIAHGLPVIGSDVYAIREMVRDGDNGILIPPPISIWDGYRPSEFYADEPTLKENVRAADTSFFEDKLVDAMLRFAADPSRRESAGLASLEIFRTQFERDPVLVA